MSFGYEKEVICHHCKLKSKAIMYPRININKDMYLKEQILDNSLFLWQCPYCHHKAILEYPLLYHDMDKQLMVYLLPNNTRGYVSDNKLQYRYNTLNILTKRVVSTLDELKEKILIFDSELNDMYLEITKFSMLDTIEKKMLSDVKKSYFCFFDENIPSLSFTFFLADRQEPYVQNVKVSAYEKAADIVDEYLAKTNIQQGFLKIDKNWAYEVMDMELSWD